MSNSKETRSRARSIKKTQPKAKEYENYLESECVDKFKSEKKIAQSLNRSQQRVDLIFKCQPFYLKTNLTAPQESVQRGNDIANTLTMFSQPLACGNKNKSRKSCTDGLYKQRCQFQ